MHPHPHYYDTTTNRATIESQIQQKNNPSFDPYSPNPLYIFDVQTDVNEFPYRRFFRGKRFSDQPHVWEREAGYSPILSTLDTSSPNPSSLRLAPRSTYFQVPCSTQFPSSSVSSSSFQPTSSGCIFSSP